MDICIGGLLNGQKRHDNQSFFKVENHYCDSFSEYTKEYFNLNGQIFSFWISKEIDFFEAQKKIELYLINIENIKIKNA